MSALLIESDRYKADDGARRSAVDWLLNNLCLKPDPAS
jgi:hypothetical protein